MDARQSAGRQPQPGLLRQAWNWVGQEIEKDRKKWGGITPGAMFRLGVAELREAASLGDNIAPPTPLGMYGTMTPGEVGTAREKKESDLRRMEEEPLASPSQIAYRKASGSGHGDQDQDHGHGPSRGRGM